MFFSRKATDGNRLVRDWIVPVDQPVIWVFQPPRSGGTLFLRLFDGHPQVHVHPAPMNNIRWPTRPNLEKISTAFSLAKHNEVGFFKTASKRKQPVTPIYFDVGWYNAILADQAIDTPRQAFSAGATARFNAWRNYQNLYGEKRYQLMHSTIWKRTPTTKMIDNFFSAYPDGYLLFIARKPEDWLVSALKQGGLYLETDDPLEEYVPAYERIQHAIDVHGNKIIVLDFDMLVRKPKETLAKLCNMIGLDYRSSLGTTTANGMPVPANSSHDSDLLFAPDPSLVGKGAEIIDTARALPKFVHATALFDHFLGMAANNHT